jgi:catabolite repression HPr-like protein
MKQQAINIQLPGGLEARPVAMLVQIASKYRSTVYIEAESKKVNAKSIMGMMSLGLGNGEEVTVITEGEDEQEALQEMLEYLGGTQG